MSFMEAVKSSQNLGVICDDAQGPMVAFSHLNLPEPARKYVAGINYHRDYGARKPVDPFKEMRADFTVTNWMAEPSHSRAAKKALGRNLQHHLHPRNGRTELLESITDHFAMLASAIDRRTLHFSLRIEAWPFADRSLHQDNTRTEYVGFAFLTPNSQPTQHAPPSSYDEEATPLTMTPDGYGSTRIITLTPECEAGLKSPPTETLSVWRGLAFKRASAHRRGPHAGGTRIGLCFYTDPRQNEPALRKKPGFFAVIRNTLCSF